MEILEINVGGVIHKLDRLTKKEKKELEDKGQCSLCSLNETCSRFHDNVDPKYYCCFCFLGVLYNEGKTWDFIFRKKEEVEFSITAERESFDKGVESCYPRMEAIIGVLKDAKSALDDVFDCRDRIEEVLEEYEIEYQ